MKKILNILKGVLICLIPAAAAFAAENPDITAGLDSVNQNTLAGKIISIGSGLGGLAGAAAVLMLINAGYKMITANNENDKSAAKEQFKNVLIGLGVIGLAVMIVGFVAYLIKS